METSVPRRWRGANESLVSNLPKHLGRRLKNSVILSVRPVPQLGPASVDMRVTTWASTTLGHKSKDQPREPEMPLRKTPWTETRKSRIAAHLCIGAIRHANAILTWSQMRFRMRTGHCRPLWRG